MSIFSSARFYRAAAVVAFIAGGFAGLFGVSLVQNAMDGHGSRAGNVFTGGLGTLLLLISPAIFIFGGLAWKHSKSDRMQQ